MVALEAIGTTEATMNRLLRVIDAPCIIDNEIDAPIEKDES